MYSLSLSDASAPVNMERERSLFQRREWEKRRQGWARTLLFDVGWRAPREDLKTAAATRHPHMAEEERDQLVEFALALQRGQTQSEQRWAVPTREARVEQPPESVSPAAEDAAQAEEAQQTGGGKSGPKLTAAQREQVRAVIRRELEAGPNVKAAVVQRTVAAELGITFNHTTFHAVYWRKVKLQMKKQTSRTAGPAAPAALPSGEHLTLTPGADGEWLVRMDLRVPRDLAMRIVQEVAKLLATDGAE